MFLIVSHPETLTETDGETKKERKEKKRRKEGFNFK